MHNQTVLDFWQLKLLKACITNSRVIEVYPLISMQTGSHAPNERYDVVDRQQPQSVAVILELSAWKSSVCSNLYQ